MFLEKLKLLISPKFNNNHLIEMVKNFANLRQINIEDVIIIPSDQKVGDAYLSEIIRFRIDATGTNESGEQKKVQVNVLTKIFPSNIGRRKTFRSPDFFENEICFYKAWASMKKFFVSKGLEQEFGTIFPLMLSYFSDGQNDFIALEDLSFKNYHTIERGKGIDHFHTMKVMDAFAKFHAVSLAFKDQKPEEFREAANGLKEVYFSEKYYTWYGKFQESILNLVRDAVKKELPQEYYEKIDEVLKDDLFKKACKICEKEHSHLSGLTQGDAWLPNFLFRQEEENLQITIIDFQLARWAPFSNDITFFLFTCVEDSVLSKHFDDFIDEYSLKMKHYLNLLGSSSEIFDKNEFLAGLKKNIAFTIAMVMEAVPMSLVEGFDLDQIKSDEAVPLESVWVITPFEDQERRQKVANVVKFFVDKQLI